MDLQNLAIERVILHEVFRRNDDRLRIQPLYGEELEALDAPALDALCDRVIAAMSRSDRCIEMTIANVAVNSMASVVSQLVDADDAVFIRHSRQVADFLADAQKSRAIPGGVVVAFSGSFGAPRKRIVGVIKAEVHTGFMRDQADGRFILKFLDKLLLTPQTKLYKIGLFVEHNPGAPTFDQGWKAYIYDEMMTVRDRYGAAQYFYEGFLGLAFPESSARHTKQFHDLTKNFIQSMGVPEEEKIALHNALVTYLKVDQSPTVEVTAFATAYFGDPELQDAYEKYMTHEGFPDTAVNKDLADVQSSLRTRRLVFRNQVRLIAPAEGFDDLIKIEVTDGEQNGNGEVPKWTKVTIKDRIAAQT